MSADDNIVSVKENTNKKTAVITAVNLGTAQVRANIYNRKDKLVRSLKTTVRVTPFAVSLKFAQKKVKLDLNDTTKLSVIIKPRTSHEVTNLTEYFFFKLYTRSVYVSFFVSVSFFTFPAS